MVYAMNQSHSTPMIVTGYPADTDNVLEQLNTFRDDMNFPQRQFVHLTAGYPLSGGSSVTNMSDHAESTGFTHYRLYTITGEPKECLADAIDLHRASCGLPAWSWQHAPKYSDFPSSSKCCLDMRANLEMREAVGTRPNITITGYSGSGGAYDSNEGAFLSRSLITCSGRYYAKHFSRPFGVSYYGDPSTPEINVTVNKGVTVSTMSGTSSYGGGSGEYPVLIRKTGSSNPIVTVSAKTQVVVATHDVIVGSGYLEPEVFLTYDRPERQYQTSFVYANADPAGFSDVLQWPAITTPLTPVVGSRYAMIVPGVDLSYNDSFAPQIASAWNAAVAHVADFDPGFPDIWYYPNSRTAYCNSISIFDGAHYGVNIPNYVCRRSLFDSYYQPPDWPEAY